MNRRNFFQLIKKNGIDHRVVAAAYWLAKETHRRQVRDSGDRYFEHVRRVAVRLLDGEASAAEISTALLHDCDEDGFLPQYLLERIFGPEVALSVALLSKTVPVFDKRTGAVAGRRKKNISSYYAAIRNGPQSSRRVKLADRIDNLIDMQTWAEARKRKYLKETEKYILPIARETHKGMYERLTMLCENLRHSLNTPSGEAKQ